MSTRVALNFSLYFRFCVVVAFRTKNKLIMTVNHNRVNYHKEPMKSLDNRCKFQKRGNTRVTKTLRKVSDFS